MNDKIDDSRGSHQPGAGPTGPDKHLPFFKLIDACQEGGCSVCTTLRNDEAKYFDSLLYEKVNNRHFRAKFNLGGEPVQGGKRGGPA